MNDLKCSFQRWLKVPGFTLLAVATLALGLAGSTVIFSVFNGLFLRPLPFEEPERLVKLDGRLDAEMDKAMPSLVEMTRPPLNDSPGRHADNRLALP